jgi:DNA-binding transcriptional ArsR family regulator
MMSEGPDPVALAQALADPLRLAVLHQLMGGPATVSDLASATSATQSNLSNHLALLRERRLVRAERQGRQVVYAVRDATVAELLESLARVAGARPAKATRTTPAIARARTCYDHLAGRLGVGIFDALVAREALFLTAPVERSRHMAPAGGVVPGPAARDIFGTLGISLDEVRRAKRRFATACVDWTERRPHLGGALGAALWVRAVGEGWVVREPGSRVVIVTEAGRAALWERLGVKTE